MNDNFYTDAYAYPSYGDNIRFPNRILPFPQQDYIRPSYVVDTGKSTDIVDSFGNVRYVVTLSSQISAIDVDGSIANQRVYKTVVQQVLSNDISAFLEIPADGYELDPHRAERDFNTCVQRYSSLVWSEMKDFNDIDIYAKKIKYEVLKPKCCMYCKYGVCGKCGKYECHSPKNQQVFNYAKVFPELPNKDIYAYGHPNSAWQKLPWQAGMPDYAHLPLPTQTMNRIFPTVDPLGTCENYEVKDLSASS